MKLLGMLAIVDKALNEATRDKSSYSELLDTLLQAEADYRQERKTGYRVKAASSRSVLRSRTSTSLRVARSAKRRSKNYMVCSGCTMRAPCS
jgi:hypothetical protein